MTNTPRKTGEWKIYSWALDGVHVCRVAREPFDGGLDVWGYYTLDQVSRGVHVDALNLAKTTCP